MSVCLDRFQPPTEADPEPFAVCENADCGQDIYPGDRYFETDAGEICCSVECVAVMTATEKEAV